MFDVTIIVPTKDSVRTIAGCLESLRAQTGASTEVIVVDNFSTDGTRETASRLADTVIEAGPERSAQRNAGAKAARADYLLFIDSDMVLEPDVVSACLAAAGPGSGVRAAVIPERSIGEGYWSDCRALERSCYTTDELAEEARFYEKELFRSLGGYDEDLTGGEMKDLSVRAGGETGIARAEAIIVHDEGRVTLRGAFRKKRYMARCAYRFMVKHPGVALSRGNMLFRAAYFRNAGRLASDPRHLAGMVALRLAETAGAGLGLVEGFFRNSRDRFTGAGGSER